MVSERHEAQANELQMKTERKKNVAHNITKDKP